VGCAATLFVSLEEPGVVIVLHELAEGSELQLLVNHLLRHGTHSRPGMKMRLFRKVWYTCQRGSTTSKNRWKGLLYGWRVGPIEAVLSGQLL